MAYLDPAAQSPTLRVIYRNPWERVDSNQVETWYYAHLMGSDEDQADIHRVSNTIRNLPMKLYWSRPPEELNLKYVQGRLSSMISRWTRGELDTRKVIRLSKQIREEGDNASPELLRQVSERYRDIASWDDERYQARIRESEAYLNEISRSLKSVDRWYQAGNVTALSVKAACALDAAWQARGSGTSSTVTEEGWRIFEKKSLECEELCLELLEQSRPPMGVFSSLLTAARGTDATHESVEPYVRRLNRLYPECTSPHYSIGFWLLPRWGGRSGDSASYVHAAISNAPEELQDKMYGMVHIRLADTFGGNINYFAATGANESRTFKGVRELLDEEAMANPHWIGPLIWVANYTNNRAINDAACKYYRENFPYPIGSIYREFPSFFQPCYADRPKPR